MASPTFSRVTSALAALLTLGASAFGVTELPKLLQPGVALRDLSSDGAEGVVFRFLVPEGAKDLIFQTSGGSGDCDLFARRNVHPTTSDYDDASQGGATVEKVTFPAPEAGVWYLLVQGYGSFQGVLLTARYTNVTATEPVVKFLPGPGRYSGASVVQMSSTRRGATIRYTTDGTDPDETSPRYRAPLKLTADADLRARAWLKSRPAPGPVTQADYFIEPVEAITTLESGVPVSHRAGLHGRSAYFKIVVPPGQVRMHILAQGGVGDSDLFARLGALPGAISHFHANGRRNRAQITVKNPPPGEWFIRLRGRTDFSGCTLVANFTDQQPDLIVWADTLEPYLSTETFEASDCAVAEGAITAGTHRLLRFSTESRNIGGGDLEMPPIHNANGTVNPIYQYQACHGHYHFLGFASYRLLNAAGASVATGRKVSFCLEDVEPWSATAAPNSRFDCDHQGIQAGWADVYDSGLEGQWIDVTHVAPGAYTLEATIDPGHVLDEYDFTNNTVTVPVTITPP